MPPFRNHMHEYLDSLTPILLVLFSIDRFDFYFNRFFTAFLLTLSVREQKKSIELISLLKISTL